MKAAELPAPVDRATAQHYLWGVGCHGWHLVREEGLSVIAEHMPPGTAGIDTSKRSSSSLCSRGSSAWCAMPAPPRRSSSSSHSRRATATESTRGEMMSDSFSSRDSARPGRDTPALRRSARATPRGIPSYWLVRLSLADRLRLLAFDAELRCLPRCFLDALWAGVDALGATRGREAAATTACNPAQPATDLRSEVHERSGYAGRVNLAGER
jgi:hypothetical protein